MVKGVPSQGDIIVLESNAMHVLVLSREFFNRSGLAVVCPVNKDAHPDPLHIPLQTADYQGTAMLEHLKSIDLRARLYKTIASVDFSTIQDISDAVQGIFDYYPFSGRLTSEPNHF